MFPHQSYIQFLGSESESFWRWFCTKNQRLVFRPSYLCYSRTSLPPLAGLILSSLEHTYFHPCSSRQASPPNERAKGSERKSCLKKTKQTIFIYFGKWETKNTINYLLVNKCVSITVILPDFVSVHQRPSTAFGVSKWALPLLEYLYTRTYCILYKWFAWWRLPHETGVRYLSATPTPAHTHTNIFVIAKKGNNLLRLCGQTAGQYVKLMENRRYCWIFKILGWRIVDRIDGGSSDEALLGCFSATFGNSSNYRNQLINALAIWQGDFDGRSGLKIRTFSASLAWDEHAANGI